MSHPAAPSRPPVAPRECFERYADPAPSARAPIVLIRPPAAFSAKAYSTPIIMPIGIAYLAAVLERAGYPVQLLDCATEALDRIRLSANGRYKVQGLSAEEAVERIPVDAPILGVSVMFTQEWPLIRAFVARLRESFPNARIVLGGEMVTALPEHTLRDCPQADYLVLGEGEIPFLRLCHAIRSDGPVEDIPGIAHRDGEGIHLHGLAPRASDIGDYPWPAWHLLPVESYFTPNFTLGLSRGRNMGVLATRGCPYSCTFCSSPSMWTTRYVMRDPEDVLDEIEHDIRTYGANCIDFYDLTAIVRKDWILRFCRRMEERGIRVEWQLPTGTRSEALDEESLQWLKRSGCSFVVYAPESGSAETLTRVKKKISLDRLTRSVLAAKKCGITVKLNLIVGFPFERRRDVLKTVAYALRLAWRGVDDCNLSSFSPYPGSELFREMVANGQIPVVDDDFFESLITQFDFTAPKSYCRSIGRIELSLYRIAGMALFYLLGHLRHPGRLVRFLRTVRSEGAVASSLLEQRVSDMLRRLRTSRRGDGGSPTVAAGMPVGTPLASPRGAVRSGD